MNLNEYVKVILFVILIIIASMFFITGEQPNNNNNNNDGEDNTNDITPQAAVTLDENSQKNEVKVSVMSMGNSEKVEIYKNSNKIEELKEIGETKKLNVENGDEIVIKGVIGEQKANIMKQTY